MRGMLPLVVVLLVALPVGPGRAQTAEIQLTYPDRPSANQFVVDEAELLVPEDREAIQAACSALLHDQRVPLLVVTIRSMAEHGVEQADIERYARSLYDDWGIGFERWSYGALLLVSKEDRRARIELGRDWRHRYDAEADRIMASSIVPAFLEGQYSRGLRAGVTALDSMLRGNPSATAVPAGATRRVRAPDPPRPSVGGGVILVAILAVILLLWTAVSGIRRGTSGTAWRFWRVFFEVLFFVLRLAVVFAGTSRSSSSSWGSSSGGGSSYGGGGSSFGGGSSGGGGATGSW